MLKFGENVPCKQRFLSCMAFSVKKSFQWLVSDNSWFVFYATGGLNKPTT